MPAELQFFDLAVSIAPPSGHLEPLPLLLGPNWQPNDIRLLLVSASGGSQGETNLMMAMHDDPPTGFSAAYARNPNKETHGVYYRRLVSGDTDGSTYWTKPAGWRHFMYATLTVRGVDPATNPTGGTLTITHTGADSVATATSVTVPAAGAMVFMAGNVATPAQSPWPNWPVSMGVPDGWTHLAATDKSGDRFHPYDTNPALTLIGKDFTAAGSTGAVEYPCAQGAPAFAGLWVHLTPAPDVSATITAA